MADSFRACQLIYKGADVRPRLAERLLAGASTGLGYFKESGTLNLPADRRLAFRELGLAIGLKGTTSLRGVVDRDRTKFVEARRLGSLLDSVARNSYLAEDIQRFWMDRKHRTAPTWLEHNDINTVMLATCLEPGAFLMI